MFTDTRAKHYTDKYGNKFFKILIFVLVIVWWQVQFGINSTVMSRNFAFSVFYISFLCFLFFSFFIFLSFLFLLLSLFSFSFLFFSSSFLLFLPPPLSFRFIFFRFLLPFSFPYFPFFPVLSFPFLFLSFSFLPSYLLPLSFPSIPSSLLRSSLVLSSANKFYPNPKSTTDNLKTNRGFLSETNYT